MNMQDSFVLTSNQSYEETKTYNSNSGNIYGQTAVGGILGGADSGFSSFSYLQLKYVKNTGSVTSFYGSAGGIVGSLYTNKSANIYFAANKGSVSTTHPTPGTPNYFGGIAGYLGQYGDSGQVSYISSSYNDANLSVPNAQNVGGLAGMISISGANSVMQIEKAYNVGSVNGYGFVGGLAGKIQGAGADRSVSFNQLYSAGAVTVGAAGYATTFATLMGSLSYGSTTSALIAEGLGAGNFLSYNAGTQRLSGVGPVVVGPGFATSPMTSFTAAGILGGGNGQLDSSIFALNAGINNGYPYLSGNSPAPLVTPITINVNALSKTYGDANPSLSGQSQ